MRYQHGLNDMPTNSDVKKDPDLEPSDYDLNGPIHYENLKAEISAKGPIQQVYPELRTKWLLNITPCQCHEEECLNHVITLSQIGGASTLTTSIDKEQMLECESLGNFFTQFIHNPFGFYSSGGERQIVEAEIEANFGFAPLDMYLGKISPENFPETIKLSPACKEDFLRVHTLQSILALLLRHRAVMKDLGQIDVSEKLETLFESSEGFRDCLREIYDLGFLTGRLISEHFIKTDLEPLFEKGVAAEKAAHLKGKKSGSDKRKRERLEAFFSAIEKVHSNNPDMTEQMVFEVAFSSSIPKGAQGSGQFENYSTEVRSTEPYKSRYQMLFHKPLK